MKNVQLATFSIPYYNWIPYPVGCLISYVKNNEIISNNFNFKEPLYKMTDYSDEVFKDVDILGLSNYIWNQDYNDKFAKRFKEIKPNGIVIYGGPNVPENIDDTISYKSERTFVDLFVPGPGEKKFENVLLSISEGKNKEIDETYGESWFRVSNRNNAFSLDKAPSPYLEGIFDSIIQNNKNLGMIIETNRGCPYSCSFCDWGSLTRSRVFSLDDHVVYESLEKVLKNESVERVYFADANFGMFKRDSEFISFLAQYKKDLGRHFYVDFCVTKNPGENVIDLLKVLHEELEDKERKNYRFSIQSHTPEVLRISQRDNIDNKKFYEIIKKVGVYKSATELILGMPGETVESWLDNFQKEVDLATGTTRAYKIQMLNNTPMNSKEFRERHGIVSREFKISQDFIIQPLKEYHSLKDKSFDVNSKGELFYQFETIVECNSYSTEELREIYSIWYWYSLLSNSRLAFSDMRESDFSVREQYALFKENLEKMPLFSKIWSWHNRSFDEIFLSDNDIVSSLENVNYLVKQPKYLATLYENLEQTLDELSLIYPTINDMGIMNFNNKMQEMYKIDSYIREINL